jgi:hypothetical protein
MKELCIKVEPLVDDLRKAVDHGIALSRELGVYVEFKFNGVAVFVGPDDEADEAIREYEHQSLEDFKRGIEDDLREFLVGRCGGRGGLAPAVRAMEEVVRLLREAEGRGAGDD